MTFIKNNKIKVLISTLIILSPIAVGLILWNKLPETMAIHWGISGEADNFAGKGFAVFAMPVLMAALHWVCLIVSSLDKSNKNQNKKIVGIVFWIIPIITVVVQSSVFATAVGQSFDLTNIILALVAAMFIFIGNYLPKVTQNRTLGVKLPWTLNNVANWNATHRFTGKLWVICGVISLALVFVPHPVKFWILFGVICLAAIPPFIYSYVYHKKHKKAK